MSFWLEKYVVVAIGGSIAAYKTLELLRLLRDLGARVVVVATSSALRFVTPLTLQALSGHEVLSDLFTPSDPDGMDHIRMAQRADLLIVAPATADIMARMAGGHGDSLLTAMVLARQGPILLAPAMNGAMWAHPATQRNLSQMKQDGISFCGPEFGPLVCGDSGQGRMADVSHILEMGRRLLFHKRLHGKRLLVTAGPTREMLDPVRYLSNRSSGKMGWAVCNAALRAGAHVTLIHGPVASPLPWGVEAVAVCSAQQMYDATLRQWDGASPPFDGAILTAAVADFRPERRSDEKIKKNRGEYTLSLCLNPDILAALSHRAKEARERGVAWPVIVGFAAETHARKAADETDAPDDAGADEHKEYIMTNDIVARAREKLVRKGCDLLVVNDILAPQCGFGSDTNQVTLLHRSGQEEPWPLLSKEEVGERLLARFSDLMT